MFKGFEKKLQDPTTPDITPENRAKLKETIKKLKDPTTSIDWIIQTAYKLSFGRLKEVESTLVSAIGRDGFNRILKLITHFYSLLERTHRKEAKILRKNYYFVPDFAENLKKVKIPNFDKLTVDDVFHNRGTYLELIFDDKIITIVLSRNDKYEISNITVIYYKLWLPSLNRVHDVRTTPLPSYINSYQRQQVFLGQRSGEAESIGSKLFKEVWEKVILKQNNLDPYDINAEYLETPNFLASCLLYLQSGDPDIRHMKGENPRKYKINSKDSFFEKRQKQVLSQDAVFNDYELVGWNYKKQYNVAGHWRYQACGPKWSQHKLIFIESFKKGKKND